MAKEGFQYEIRATDRSAPAYSQALSRAKGWAKAATKVVTSPFRAMTSVSTFAFIQNMRTITNAASRFIDLNAKQQAAERKLEAILRATGHAAGYSARQLKSMASELQGLTTFGDEDILQAQSILATFKDIKGKIFKEVTGLVLDVSSTLGQTDLTATATMLGKAFNDPILGLTAMRRVGIAFTQSETDMVKAMVAANDIIGAQTVMLKALQGQYGGVAAEMSKTGAGALKQFMNALSDFGEKVGQTLDPFLVNATAKLKSWVGDIEKYLAEHMEDLGGMIERSLSASARGILAGANAILSAPIRIASSAGLSIGGLAGFAAKLPVYFTKAFLKIEQLALKLVSKLADIISESMRAWAHLFSNNPILKKMGMSYEVQGQIRRGLVSVAEKLGTAGAEFNRHAVQLERPLKDIEDTLGDINKRAGEFGNLSKLAQAKRDWSEMGQRIKIAFAPLAGAAQRIIDPLTRGFRRVKEEAKSSADVLKDAYEKAAGKVKDAADRLAEAQQAILDTKIGRARRDFELDLARANEWQQRGMVAVRARTLMRSAEHEPSKDVRESYMSEVADLIRTMQADPLLKVSRRDDKAVQKLQSRFDFLEDLFNRRRFEAAAADVAGAKVEKQGAADQIIARSLNEAFVQPAKRSVKAVADAFQQTVKAVKDSTKALELLPGVVERIKEAQATGPAQAAGESQLAVLVDASG